MPKPDLGRAAKMRPTREPPPHFPLFLRERVGVRAKLRTRLSIAPHPNPLPEGEGVRGRSRRQLASMGKTPMPPGMHFVHRSHSSIPLPQAIVDATMAST